MSLLRAFIAIEIPPEIKRAISSRTASLQKESGRAVRWVATENIHLTLKFLGEISSNSLDMLSQAIYSECAQVSPFQVVVETLGCFPSLRRPRIIWIGLVIPPELKRLQRQVETSVARLGYAPDDKPFSPHLTIGRVREQATAAELQNLRELLEQTTINTLGSFSVNEVNLYKSELKPEGPVYTRLSGARLAG